MHKINLMDVEAHFDGMVAQYDRYKHSRGGLYHNKLKQWFKGIIHPGLDVLELGCGTGDILAVAGADPRYTIPLKVLEWLKLKMPEGPNHWVDFHRLPGVCRWPFRDTTRSRIMGFVQTLTARKKEAR